MTTSRKQLLLVVVTACVCDSLLVVPQRVTRCSPATMAQGFGAPPAKPKGLTEKKQWKTYQELVLKGEPTVQVMVRIPDTKDAKWYGVGKVTAGGEGTIAQAVEQQKRLIMEHARRVHTPLKEFKDAFDIGLQADPELEPFVHTSERVEVPPTLVAGFRGMWKPAAQSLGPWASSPSSTPRQRQIKLRVAISLGQPRPVGRHVLPHRPCFPPRFEGVPDPATGLYMKKKTKKLGRPGSAGGGPPR